MKRFSVFLVATILILSLLVSCATGLLKTAEDASDAVEILFAGIMPVFDAGHNVDPLRAEIAIWGGQTGTQSGGGIVRLETISKPDWDSSFDSIDSSSYYFLVTFTDFAVSHGDADYTVNGTFWLAYQRETIADDFEFTLILSGNDVSISGKGIDDTFDLDVRTVIDIDITADTTTCEATITGSIEGTVNDIVLNVPDWSYMFEFDTILVEES